MDLKVDVEAIVEAIVDGCRRKEIEGDEMNEVKSRLENQKVEPSAKVKKSHLLLLLF